ncbi:AmmeMemoRadiSam system radical SAM enzyme [Patescibacteria group bacterium]|nr:AmmeMemoRadiSam system radical SAM enzyme [Patescibacteria group bacterium]
MQKSFSKGYKLYRGILKKAIMLCLILGTIWLAQYSWIHAIGPCANYKKIASGTNDIPALHEALYYSKLPNNRIQCLLCPRNCILKNGQRGFCNARINKKGKCYSLVYGKARVNTNGFPIYQRSLIYCAADYRMLRLGTVGCNMRCKFCLTSQYSQATPEEIEIVPSLNNIDAISGATYLGGNKMNFALTPQEVIALAEKYNCKIINYCFNEPTVYYEYVLDIAKLAKERGWKNVLNTCGYINKEPLIELLEYMDGVSVGLKGFTEEVYRKYCSAELSPVLETLKVLRDEEIGFEVAYVVIPKVNDDLEQIRNLCVWIKQNLGEDVPLHFIRYHPSYLLQNIPPTPLNTLKAAKEMAYTQGVRRVYIYYLREYPGPDFEEKIYCPNCGKLILHRKDKETLFVNNTAEGRCKFCGERLLLFYP